MRREADAAQDYTVLAVQDIGIGIPAEDGVRVFERFQRAVNNQGRCRKGDRSW